MRSENFWDFFDSVSTKLEKRSQGFSRIFEYLDKFDRAVGIVETGCMRQYGNWAGDGNSTVLFDRYAQTHPNSKVITVDIDPEATQTCRSHVSEQVSVHTGDSVKFLQTMADAPRDDFPFVDLLYLDSYDLNLDDSLPSALHHMKELVAAAPLIRSDTMVVVDDCFVSCVGIRSKDGQILLVKEPAIEGKGRFVADYAKHVGAEQMLDGYQCAWVKMRAAQTRSAQELDPS